MSRIRRTLFAVVCGRGVMALRQLLLVPILLRSWGVDYYGHWLMLTAIPSFLAMSNLGLGTSAGTRLALQRADAAPQAGARTVATAWTLIAVILVGLVATLFAWNRAFPEHFAAIEGGLWILLLLLGGQFLRMFSQPIHGWWVSKGKVSRSLHLGNLFAFGELLVYAAIPICGGSGIHLAAGVAAWALIWLQIYLWRSYVAGCRLYFRSKPCITEAKSLLAVGIGHQASPLWQAILFQGTILLAGNLFGATGAALWGAVRTLVRAGNQILELVSQSVGPEFQVHHAAQELEANRNLHAKSLLLSLLLSTFAAAGLVTIGPTAFGHWTRDAFSVPTSMWWIMALSLIPYSLWWVSGEYQRATNRPWVINICGVLAALASVTLTWCLAPLGYIALAWATLGFEVLMASFIMRRTLVLLGDPFPDFINRLATNCSGILRLTWATRG